MRSRGEIQSLAHELLAQEKTELAFSSALLLEVLLDIRELLESQALVNGAKVLETLTSEPPK